MHGAAGSQSTTKLDVIMWGRGSAELHPMMEHQGMDCRESQHVSLRTVGVPTITESQCASLTKAGAYPISVTELDTGNIYST